MKILVVGGSYFFGRVFVMLAAKEADVTVLNRGTYSVAQLGAKEIRGDRKDTQTWKACAEDYDVIVDFCAYEQNDISRALENLPGSVRQYVFVSTVDVYRRGMGNPNAEDAPFETRSLPGEAGAYIAGKVALERELMEECGKRGIAWTVLRPAILYGPFNYAPRESAYIQLLVQNHVLPRVVDATGLFQFVYVKDAAEAVLKCLLNPKAYGQAYNLCGDEIVTYESFAQALAQAADVEWEEVSLTVEQAVSQGLPLPFPVTRQESELCANGKSKAELDMAYTELTEGMARTYRAFKNVYAT